MIPQLPSESAILAEMKERERQFATDPTLPEAYRWFDRPKRIRPNWIRAAVWHAGHFLVFIGHQLEDAATQLTTAPSRQVESM